MESSQCILANIQLQKALARKQILRQNRPTNQPLTEAINNCLDSTAILLCLLLKYVSHEQANKCSFKVQTIAICSVKF